MKKLLITLGFSLACFFSGYSQIEKHTTQVGASGLPVFDVLNVFPKNSISGFGAMVNLGFFPIKNMAVGMNPFYAQVSNSYDYQVLNFTVRKKEILKIYGLNMYAKYYIFLKNKFSLYPNITIGLGNLTQTGTISEKESSVVVGSLGLGVNYFLNNKIAVELNIPYLDVQGPEVDGIDFKTIVPTIGIQFFFK